MSARAASKSFASPGAVTRMWLARRSRPSRPRLPHAGDLDDVEAELGFDDRAHLVLAQLEHRILERLDHRAAAEAAEVAPLGSRAGILRARLGQLGEAATGPCAPPPPARRSAGAAFEPLAPLRRRSGCGCLRYSRPSNCASRLVELLARPAMSGVSSVSSSDTYSTRICSGASNSLRVRLVVRLDRIGRELHLRRRTGSACSTDSETSRLSALSAAMRSRGRLGDQRGIGQAGRELPHHEVAAQLRFELRLAHVLAADQRLVPAEENLPSSWKAGSAAISSRSLVVGHGHAVARDVQPEHPASDQAVEQLRPRTRGCRAAPGRSSARARTAAGPAAGAAARPNSAAEIVLPSTDATIAEPAEAVERLDAEERERRDQDQREQNLQQALVLGYEVEHGPNRAKLTSPQPVQCT